MSEKWIGSVWLRQPKRENVLLMSWCAWCV